MKKGIVLLLTLAMALVMAGCGDTPVKPIAGADGVATVGQAAVPEEVDDEKDTLSESFLETVNAFGYRTAPEMLKEGTENVCYSPLSLYYALALVTAGADGETANQLLEVLGTDQKTLASQCKELYRWLYQEEAPETGSKRLIANSLWMDQEVQGETVSYREEFVNNVGENYYASLFSADFSSPETGKAIAKWIEDNTNGLLSYQPEVSEDMMLAIVNTIYLKDQWVNQFEKALTKLGIFTKADGSQITCDFMHQTADGGYYRGENYTAATLPMFYNSMTFILPDEGVTPEELLQNQDLIREAIQGCEKDYAEVVWALPSFAFDTELAPIEALERLGVQDAFAPGADFSRLSDKPAYISSIQQGTHIGVDENGVEAAAYTVVGMDGAGLPPEQVELTLDRPFVFAVTSNQGVVLFLGICGDPSAS